MDIALHLGAHLTDETQLRACLRANQEKLLRAGVLVPRARSYLNLIIEAATHIESGHAASGIDTQLMESVEADATTRRLVLAAPGLLSKLAGAMDGSTFYPGAADRIAALRQIFAGYDTEIFLAIRNPASFVPAYLNSVKDKRRAAVLETLRSEELRWSRLVTQMREGWPEARLTMWCDEDTPFIWHRLLQIVSGHVPRKGFEGSFAWFNSVMVEGGAEKLEAYLNASPPVDEAHRQQVISVFLEKFCDEAKLDIDVGVTGWDETRVDVLSQLYEQDTDVISTLEGVRFIQP